MKIYAIGDLHISTNSNKPMDIFGENWKNYLDKIISDWKMKVTDEDVVLICGDISWAMDLASAISDINIIKDLKGKKIFIKGNHDYWWSAISKVREALPNNCYALQNDSMKIENFVFCGTRLWSVPGTPDYTENDKKLYLREVERLKLSLKNAKTIKAESDKLIAIVHFPPFNVKREDTLYTKLFEEYNVDSVIYGHLHGKNVRSDKLIIKNGIKYYLTSCDQVDFKLTEIY